MSASKSREMVKSKMQWVSLLLLALGLVGAGCKEPPSRTSNDAPKSASVAPWAALLNPRLPLGVETFHASIIDIVHEQKGDRSGDQPVYLASGIKLFILIAAYQLRHQGELRFDEKIRYGRNDVRDGAPSMNRNKFGFYSVDALLLYAIRDSDNAAADLLLGHLGADRVQSIMREHGVRCELVPLMHVRREVYAQLDPRSRKLDAVQVRDVRWRNGFEPRLDLLKKHIGRPYGDYEKEDLDRAYRVYYTSAKNHASLNSITDVLSRLVKGELVSKEVDARILERLQDTWTSRARTDKYLRSDVRIAHKTGTQRRRILDVGVAWLTPQRPIAFAFAASGERLSSEALVANVFRDLASSWVPESVLP